MNNGLLILFMRLVSAIAGLSCLGLVIKGRNLGIDAHREKVRDPYLRRGGAGEHPRLGQYVLPYHRTIIYLKKALSSTFVLFCRLRFRFVLASTLLGDVLERLHGSSTGTMKTLRLFCDMLLKSVTLRHDFIKKFLDGELAKNKTWKDLSDKSIKQLFDSQRAYETAREKLSQKVDLQARNTVGTFVPTVKTWKSTDKSISSLFVGKKVRAVVATTGGGVVSSYCQLERQAAVAAPSPLKTRVFSPALYSKELLTVLRSVISVRAGRVFARGQQSTFPASLIEGFYYGHRDKSFRAGGCRW